MKCLNCGAEIPEVSRFCLSCGREVPPPKQAVFEDAHNPDPHGHAMMLFALSFMMFFFAIMPFVLGMWIGGVVMVAVGGLLVFAGLYVLRSNRRQVVEAKKEAAVRVKCRYCGTLNDQDASRCLSCGAAL